VYVNENGEAVALPGLTVPAPLSLIVTFVALPPKALLVTVTAVVPQVDPPVLFNVIIGSLTHPHDTSKLPPVVVHPEELRTVTV
jgi:hypothetical protein